MRGLDLFQPHPCVREFAALRAKQKRFWRNPAISELFSSALALREAGVVRIAANAQRSLGASQPRHERREPCGVVLPAPRHFTFVHNDKAVLLSLHAIEWIAVSPGAYSVRQIR
ncbi:MAG: hypothetical protein AAB354_11795 [candidate division KSB1 bacterium]